MRPFCTLWLSFLDVVFQAQEVRHLFGRWDLNSWSGVFCILQRANPQQSCHCERLENLVLLEKGVGIGTFPL